MGEENSETVGGDPEARNRQGGAAKWKKAGGPRLFTFLRSHEALGPRAPEPRKRPRIH